MTSNLVVTKPVVIVGSNSIHTIRFITGVAPYCNQIVFISHSLPLQELPPNVKCFIVNFKLGNFRAKKQIATIIREINPAVVHIHQANSFAYHTIRGVKLSGIPAKIILTTWGSDILVLPKQNLLFKLLVKFNLKHPDIITSDSLFMSSEIQKLCPKVQNIHTINFGVKTLPTLIDLNLKENIILSNRLHKPLYNIDKIINGFAKFIKTSPEFANYKLVIAADGSESTKLIEQAEKLAINSNIIFTGMLGMEELHTWYKKAKFFISIPTSDATSISLLEAMAYGCYPIISNIPANLEWVIDDINGTICQKLELLDHDLAHAINKISLQHNYDIINRFNHNLVKQKASFENNMGQFVNLYKKNKI